MSVKRGAGELNRPASLSSRDRQIASFVLHRAEAPVAEIAQLVGCSEHSVRHSLDKLKQSRVLARQAYIDVYRIGLSYNTLFFSLMPHSKKESARLITYLKNSPRVSYFVALGGDFDFCIDICVRENLELLEFMQELSSSFGALFNTKAHQSMIALTDYPLDLCGGGRNGQKPLSLGLSTHQRVSIDKVDHRILSLLSNHPTLSHGEMARKLEIPSSTFQYRIQRLEKEGVVRGYRYFPDASMFGLQSFIHCVYLRGVSRKLQTLLIDFCEHTPCITYHLECAGSWDFEFGTSVYTAHEVISVINELQQKFEGAIAKVNTIPLFMSHKVSKYPFPLEWS